MANESSVIYRTPPRTEREPESSTRTSAARASEVTLFQSAFLWGRAGLCENPLAQSARKHTVNLFWTLEMEQVATNVPVGRIELSADVSLPDHAKGLVLFAHGSGSSRHSPRNRHVADVLNRGAVGTILIDLLTADE